MRMRNIEVGQGFEIRMINGKEVFVKQIADNFWLFNDCYADLCSDYEVTDKVIDDFLNLKYDLYVPYQGAEKGFVLGQYRVSEGYALGDYPLDSLTDKNLIKEVQKAYEEYKVWAGI